MVSECHISLLLEGGRLCRVRYSEEQPKEKRLVMATQGREVVGSVKFFLPLLFTVTMPQLRRKVKHVLSP